jgi:hypothetical protein
MIPRKSDVAENSSDKQQKLVKKAGKSRFLEAPPSDEGTGEYVLKNDHDEEQAAAIDCSDPQSDCGYDLDVAMKGFSGDGLSVNSSKRELLLEIKKNKNKIKTTQSFTKSSS